MVVCSVPTCGEDNWRCDPTVTFHEFPASPDLAAKWVKQINTAMKSLRKPLWMPKGKPLICSKHFLQTDFNEDSDTLKSHCIPTVFGHKYIGFDQSDDTVHNSINGNKKSPLIVKVNRPKETDLIITDVFSQAPGAPENEAPKSINLNVEALKNSLKSKMTQKTFPQVNHNPTKASVFKDSAVKKTKKKVSTDNNLIEIGPNTFLKINPEIIKVNKKQTPAGNTVLQFIMNQKMANSNAAEMLPTLIQSVTNPKVSNVVVPKKPLSSDKEHEKLLEQPKKDTVVEHVLGHLVDTHVCKDNCIGEEEACEDMILDDNESTVPNGVNITDPLSISLDEGTTSNAAETTKNGMSPGKSNSNVLNKAPVLFTTNIPISHCMMDKPKYMSQLRQKQRQIASLKFKITSLTKKVEELEDRCIVQERQLSYSFIKRLKAIRKNASNGDPCATYILEQIRCYSGKTKMRWSDSTLSQCAVWCRKAPYAYEYFKKADFFKLPCLGTVKRYMKKHPELKLQNKSNSVNPDEDDSSSDFDFDESDSGNEQPENSDVEKLDPTSTCETILDNAIDSTNAKTSTETLIHGPTPGTSEPMDQTESSVVQENGGPSKDDKSDKLVEMSAFPVAVDGSNLEVQEIILPSGEVVQCYSSSLCNGGDSGNQYYIIPNVGDQNSGVDHEYNVVHSGESLPVILQNLEHAQLPMQQEQLIFITNSSDQVECSETEVITA